MLEGVSVIDAHVHAARWPKLEASWMERAEHFGKDVPLDDLYAEEGTLVPPEELERQTALGAVAA
jgi:hypothetical protein